MKTTSGLLILLTASLAVAQDTTKTGQVQLPLDTYNTLVDSARDPVRPPVPAPATYALGTAAMTVTVSGGDANASADVAATLRVDILENEWSTVPLLPASTPVESVSVDGGQVQLVAKDGWLSWSTKAAGSHTFTLKYRADASASEAGFTLAVPVPAAAPANLTATLPGANLDIAVIPAAGVRSQASGSTTRVTAAIPPSSGIQISWRRPAAVDHSLGRASYRGELVNDAVAFTGELDVELFAAKTITLPLLPSTATLRELQVDGKAAPILIEGQRFAALIGGQGKHTVTISFEVPVVRGDGPPRVNLDIPAVPVSRFDLVLPGKKEVTVNPAANVTSRTQGERTVCTVFVPMSQKVSFTWAEAVPEDIRAEVRANAGVYHTIHAEEGLLSVRALITYEVTRGETNLIPLEVPAEVQVNRITSPSGAVADWRAASTGGGGGLRRIDVFLDRQLEGELLLDVSYDLPLTADQPMVAPLLRTPAAQRQRGMVALLASRDLTLTPVDEGSATRVGENQLPAFVRETVDLTVAHTFKYVEEPPRIEVVASPPERKQGRFDAQVDTLVSLGEVTLKCATTVEIAVKSGEILELEMSLPKGANLLSLAGPSLRAPAGATEEGLVTAQFTQPMDGSFRLELSYERIIVDTEAEVEVPILIVRGAEVAQGRIAVEALSAVEVQAGATGQLSVLDVGELPQQLVLRTTNPILMAYKYAGDPGRLTLKVTRHEVLSVQEAAIDEAHYQTLFTRDGLAVTTAHFVVRNSRKQFLRLALPKDTDVWSVFVDGQLEKPAKAEDGRTNSVLIKIVNSTRGFPVQLIYATKSSRIGRIGTVKAELPHPDILVTRTRWDVYLPEGVSYGEPHSNMDIVTSGVKQSLAEMSKAVEELAQDESARRVVEPLRITVPTTGLHFAFEKLYANQREERAGFSLGFASGAAAGLGRALSLIGALLLWAGVVIILKPQPRLLGRDAAIVMAAAGALVLGTAIWLNISLIPAFVLWVILSLTVVGRMLWRRRQVANVPEEP
jgi:hypothetical protein